MLRPSLVSSLLLFVCVICCLSQLVESVPFSSVAPSSLLTPSQYFDPTTGRLSLTNLNITSINANDFARYTDQGLLRIDLSHNSLSFLPAGVFLPLVSTIVELNFGSNLLDVTCIDQFQAGFGTQFKRLDLSHNSQLGVTVGNISFPINFLAHNGWNGVIDFELLMVNTSLPFLHHSFFAGITTFNLLDVSNNHLNLTAMSSYNAAAFSFNLNGNTNATVRLRSSNYTSSDIALLFQSTYFSRCITIDLADNLLGPTPFVVPLQTMLMNLATIMNGPLLTLNLSLNRISILDGNGMIPAGVPSSFRYYFLWSVDLSSNPINSTRLSNSIHMVNSTGGTSGVLNTPQMQGDLMGMNNERTTYIASKLNYSTTFPLTFLSLRNCSLTTLPGGFLSVVSYATIDLTQNPGLGLTPGSLGVIADPALSGGFPTSIQRILLNDNQIRYLPPNFIQGISQLQFVNLDNNNLVTPTSIPSAAFTNSIASSSNFTLSLRNANLQSLPDSFCAQSHIGSLIMTGNQLGMVNGSFSSMVFNNCSIAKLDMSNSSISFLPSTFLANTGVQAVKMSNNMFNVDGGLAQYVFANIGTPSSPATIDLSNSSLSFIPPYAFAFSFLSKLDLTGVSFNSPVALRPYSFAYLGASLLLATATDAAQNDYPPDPTVTNSTFVSRNSFMLPLLNLSHAGLQYIPDYTFQYSFINTLDLSFSRLGGDPDLGVNGISMYGICFLNLHVLNLSNCNITQFSTQDNTGYPIQTQFLWNLNYHIQSNVSNYLATLPTLPPSSTQTFKRPYYPSAPADVILNMNYNNFYMSDVNLYYPKYSVDWTYADNSNFDLQMELSMVGSNLRSFMQMPRSWRFTVLNFSLNNFDSYAFQSYGSPFYYTQARVLDLTNSGITDLPTMTGAQVSNYIFAKNNLAPTLDGHTNNAGAGRMNAYINMYTSGVPFTLDLSNCGLQYLNTDFFIHAGYGPMIQSLLLNNNNFSATAARPQPWDSVFTDAAFVDGAKLSLANSNINQLPPNLFRNAPLLASLDLSGNLLNLALSIPALTFNRLNVTALIMNSAGLTGASFHVNSFTGLSATTIDMGNKLTGCSNANPSLRPAQCNRFDPFPSGLFHAGITPALTALTIGDIISLNTSTFADWTLKNQSAVVNVEWHFAPTVEPIRHIIRALTYTAPPVTPAPNLLLNLLLTGSNLQMLDANTSADPILTPCYQASCFLFPQYMRVSLEPAFMQRPLFTGFGFPNLRRPADLLHPLGPQNLTFIMPSMVSPYAAAGSPVPWHPTLSPSSMSSDLLCDLIQLTAFAIDVRVPAMIAKDASQPAIAVPSPPSPFTSLPNGLFQCLAAENGGSLLFVTLPFAGITHHTNYLAGATTPQLNLILNLNSIYNGIEPVPLGFFDDLDFTAVVSANWNDPLVVSTSRCAYQINGQCVACPSGYWDKQLVTYNLIKLEYCSACMLGNSCNSTLIFGSRPKNCPAGTFQSSKAQSSCIKCEAGTYQPSLAQIAPSACIACPLGTASSVTGLSDYSGCTSCDSGKYTAAAGQATCTQCNPGYYQPNMRSSVCISCPMNSYNPNYGSFNSSDCIPCPASTPLSAPGSISINSCSAITCRNGYFRLGSSAQCDGVCPKGSYCSGDGSIRPCAAGFYSNAAGSSDCTPCFPGSYSGITGADSSSACQPCGVGSFQDQYGQASCKSCPASSTSNSIGATSNSTCITTACGVSGVLCPTGSAAPLQLSQLQLQATTTTQLNSYFTSIAAFQRYTATRDSYALRSTIPAWATDAILVANGATGNQTANQQALLPVTSGTTLSTKELLTLILVLCAVAITPIILFRLMPATVWTKMDAFPKVVISRLKVGEYLENRHSPLGAALTFSFVPVALLVAIVLGTDANLIVSNALLPVSATQRGGTAISDIQITLKGYNADTRNDPSDSWCNTNSIFSAQSGFSDTGKFKRLKLTPTVISNSTNAAKPGICALAIDCLGCGVAGTSTFSLTFPASVQLIEYDVFTTGAISGSFVRLGGVLSQLPNSMLDANGEVHFNVLESFFDDSRHSTDAAAVAAKSTSTTNTYSATKSQSPYSRSGLQISFLEYVTKTAQDPNAIQASSTVTVNFVFHRADTVYSTSISQRDPLFTILMQILAVLSSIFGVWSALYIVLNVIFMKAGLIPPKPWEGMQNQNNQGTTEGKGVDNKVVEIPQTAGTATEPPVVAGASASKPTSNPDSASSVAAWPATTNAHTVASKAPVAIVTAKRPSTSAAIAPVSSASAAPTASTAPSAAVEMTPVTPPTKTLPQSNSASSKEGPRSAASDSTHNDDEVVAPEGIVPNVPSSPRESPASPVVPASPSQAAAAAVNVPPSQSVDPESPGTVRIQTSGLSSSQSARAFIENLRRRNQDMSQARGSAPSSPTSSNQPKNDLKSPSAD